MALHAAGLRRDAIGKYRRQVGSWQRRPSRLGCTCRQEQAPQIVTIQIHATTIGLSQRCSSLQVARAVGRTKPNTSADLRGGTGEVVTTGLAQPSTVVWIQVGNLLGAGPSQAARFTDVPHFDRPTPRDWKFDCSHAFSFQCCAVQTVSPPSWPKPDPTSLQSHRRKIAQPSRKSHEQLSMRPCDYFAAKV